jgi:hypothetical protein
MVQQRASTQFEDFNKVLAEFAASIGAFGIA